MTTASFLMDGLLPVSDRDRSRNRRWQPPAAPPPAFRGSFLPQGERCRRRAIPPETKSALRRARLDDQITLRASASVHRLHRHAEEIAGAALGLDVARLRRVFLDLAAQAHDLHVDRAVVDL